MVSPCCALGKAALSLATLTGSRHPQGDGGGAPAAGGVMSLPRASIHAHRGPSGLDPPTLAKYITAGQGLGPLPCLYPFLLRACRDLRTPREHVRRPPGAGGSQGAAGAVYPPGVAYPRKGDPGPLERPEML